MFDYGVIVNYLHFNIHEPFVNGDLIKFALIIMSAYLILLPFGRYSIKMRYAIIPSEFLNFQNVTFGFFKESV